ncbi:DUF2437 domain-containing protein [Curtobacterium flaccumfaciens]|nr:DUF2437 domain-containing protein [Curtobacterium flaccumfaciens]
MKIARFSSKGEDPGTASSTSATWSCWRGPDVPGVRDHGERVPLADAKLLAPVIPRSKVIGVGLNYAEHASEMDERAGTTRWCSSSRTPRSSARRTRSVSRRASDGSTTRVNSPS